MILWAYNYLSKIPPVWLDGFLYMGIAIFQFLQTSFSSDEARVFINDNWLFWIKIIVGTASAGMLAVKLFRSTSYADHKASTGNTTQFTKP